MKYHLATVVAAVSILSAAVLGFAVIASAQTTASSTMSASTTCPLITSFMKQGAANDPIQVTRLQTFLRDTEHLSVDVNGVYDQKTEDAVKDFQRLYLTDIMGPWGATQGSGVVYTTTSKKINQIACDIPLSLSAPELAVIAAYPHQTDSIGVVMTPTASDVTTAGPMAPTQTATENTSQEGTLVYRFVEFMKGLF